MSSNVAKSYNASADPLIHYITELSVHAEPIQKELQAATLENANKAHMLGAPEVLELGRNMLHLIHGKKVLDVGTFTGASALAWALAIPEDGRVVSMDVSHAELDKVGRPILERCPELLRKIDFRLGPALETLDALLASSEKGSFDFAFIDADKANQTNYYERCVELLRPGGVILVDNALWSGEVLCPTTALGKEIDRMNKRAAEDERTLNTLLNVADGVHLIIKKNE